MARQTTSRGWPYYAGGDIPAGHTQQQDLATVLNTSAAKVDQGTTASRPATREARRLYWDSQTKELLYDDGTTLETAMPRTAAGDLSGTWPAPTVSKITSNNLPVHSDGSRRLIRETRTILSANGGTAVGELSHLGAAVSVTTITTSGSVQQVARYEIAAVPAQSLGGSPRVAPVSISGTGPLLVELRASQSAGSLFLTLAHQVGGANKSVIVLIDVQSASPSTWTPTSATGTVNAGSPWVGGGRVGPQVSTALPVDPYNGMECQYRTPDQSGYVGPLWRLQWDADYGHWGVSGPPLMAAGTASLSLTVPLAGRYVVETNIQALPSAKDGWAQLSVTGPAGSPSFALLEAVAWAPAAGTQRYSGVGGAPLTLLAGPHTATITTAGGTVVKSAYLKITPQTIG